MKSPPVHLASPRKVIESGEDIVTPKSKLRGSKLKSSRIQWLSSKEASSFNLLPTVDVLKSQEKLKGLSVKQQRARKVIKFQDEFS
jgi:hypothetical protein